MLNGTSGRAAVNVSNQQQYVRATVSYLDVLHSLSRWWYYPAQMYSSQYSTILNLLTFSDKLFVQLRPFQVTLSYGRCQSTQMTFYIVIYLYIAYSKLCRIFGSDLGLVTGSTCKRGRSKALPVTIRPGLNFFSKEFAYMKQPGRNISYQLVHDSVSMPQYDCA
jgi:hypothetical protein